MAMYGKKALELYKEIAMCPPEVFPPYNVSVQSHNSKLTRIPITGMPDIFHREYRTS